MTEIVVILSLQIRWKLVQLHIPAPQHKLGPNSIAVLNTELNTCQGPRRVITK